MRLPTPPQKYRPEIETRRNAELERQDARNRKQGQDIEIEEESFILPSPDGTRFRVKVANDGTLSTEAV